MIKGIFRKLFSEPAPKQNEIELRNAIIGALTQHLTRLGHPVEAVRIPAGAMPNREGSAFTNTFFGSSSLRLIAGLDAFGNNVVTGRTASATATSSTLEGRLAEAAEWLGQGEPWTGNAALTRGSLASANFAARPSSALSPTWAETSRAYNEGLDRAAPSGSAPSRVFPHSPARIWPLPTLWAVPTHVPPPLRRPRSILPRASVGRSDE